MKRKGFCCLLALTLAVSTLAGCGKNGTETTTAGAESGKNTEASQPLKNAEKKEIILTWINHTSEEGTIAWQDLMAKEFEEANPGVKMDIQRMSYDNYITTIQTKFASGDAPDLFEIEIANVPTYAANGYMMDLTDNSCVKNIDPENMESLSVNGRIYAVPISANVTCATYNKTVFAAAGIEKVPETLDEFYEVCETLKAAGYAPIANGYKSSWCLMADMQSDYIPSVLMKDREAITKAVNREETFADSELWRETFERLGKRYQYSSSDAFGTDWDSACSMLANGEAGMTLNGNWAAGNILAKNAEADLGVFPMPTSNTAEETKLILQSPSGGTAVNGESANKEMAARFIEHMATADAGTKYSDMTKNIAIAKGIQESQDPVLQEMFGYLSSEKSGELGAVDHNFPNENRVALETLAAQFLLDGGTEVDGFLKQLDAEFDLIAEDR